MNWGRPRLEAIRTAEHLYVEYETGERELYDLEEDPYEVHNLYENAGSDLVRRAGGSRRCGVLRGGLPRSRAVTDEEPYPPATCAKLHPTVFCAPS